MNGQPAKTRARRILSAKNNPPGAMKRRSGGYTLVELVVIMAIIGILATIGSYSYNSWKLKEMNSRAEYDIRMISVAIDEYKLDNGVYPPSLSVLPGAPFTDPWGNPYQYLDIADTGPSAHSTCRKDRNENPINTDYDLYSMGADGKTGQQLTSKYGQDDIVRAENGAYIGLASDF